MNIRPEDIVIEERFTGAVGGLRGAVKAWCRITHKPTGASAEATGTSMLQAKSAAIGRLREAIALARGYVEVEPPPQWEGTRAERWRYVLESIAGGMDDDGMLKWLGGHATMAEALAEARKLRDGQVAT